MIIIIIIIVIMLMIISSQHKRATVKKKKEKRKKTRICMYILIYSIEFRIHCVCLLELFGWRVMRACRMTPSRAGKGRVETMCVF